MLDRATVDHVAELAKLGLSPDERAQLRRQLSEILAYVDQLAQLDLPDDQASSYRAPDPQQLRTDEAEPSLPRDAALANAPDVADGRFRVPPLFE